MSVLNKRFARCLEQRAGQCHRSGRCGVRATVTVLRSRFKPPRERTIHTNGGASTTHHSQSDCRLTSSPVMAVGKVRPRILHLSICSRSPRISVSPRVRKVSRKRSSTPSLARVCLLASNRNPSHLSSEWYDIKAPSTFEVKNIGKTLVNRSQGLSMCPLCLILLF